MSLLQNVKTEESPVAPDSTTADRLVFNEREDILLHGEDGLFYFGTIVKVQLSEEKCLVRFGDDTEKWAQFRDLRKVKLQDDADISCILCKSVQSTPNNRILLCHYCRRGYHQNCHEPTIPSQFANNETHWMCTKCVEKRQVKGKTVINNNPTKTISRQTLPYDLASLKWDNNHETNSDRKYCYCGQDGEWFKRMLKCCRCLQWFHDECISILKQPLLFGDKFFLFLCSVCNKGNGEKLQRLGEELTLADMAHLALYNLTLESARKYHDLDNSVLPFLEKHWKYFQPCSDLVTLSNAEIRNKVLAAFWQFKIRFMCGRELKKKKTMWGLRVRLPPPFPTELSLQSQRTKLQWINGEVSPLRPTNENASPNSSEELPEIKKSPELQRKLRVRQLRVTSEESVCEESSDEPKPNKRKRTGSYSIPLSLPTNTDSKGTLEVFIPTPKNFDGLNNPFCNGRNAEYLFVRPLKTKDIRITKNGEVKRKRFLPKWKHKSPDPPKELSFFGIEERVSRGETYTVHARRILPIGHMQYLLQWEDDQAP